MATTTHITKLSYSELQELIQKAEQARDSKKMEEMKVIVDACAKKLEAAGLSIKDGVEYLKTYMPRGTRISTRTGQPVGRRTGEYKDVDKDGKRPEVGATYKLPNGATWNKKSKVGAANKDFVNYVKEKGVTWDSLKAGA